MDREIKVLGRVISYHDWGWSMEADPSLLETAVEQLGLQSAKGAAAPGAKVDGINGGVDIRARRMGPADIENPESAWPGYDSSAPLEGDQLRRFQSVAALLNYIAQDRPDLLYPIKELMRKMSNATANDEARLKRAVRYLKTMPRIMSRYPWQALPSMIEVYTDSDHAGCPVTRRSTLGGCILWGDASSKVGRRHWRSS